MLSRRSWDKIRKFDQQYGPPEESFSPRWHEQNPTSPHHLPVIQRVEGTADEVHNAVEQTLTEKPEKKEE